MTDMWKDSLPRHIAAVWSEPVNGLSGRVLVEFEDLQPGLRHAVFLELKNHSFTPVAALNQPEIRAELYDSFEKPLRTSAVLISGPMPSPQWAVIPRDAYVGFRVDMQTVGVPTADHGTVLLAVGGKAWELKAGKYGLETRLAFKLEEEGPPNQWVGELELPSVEVVVTAEMLNPNYSIGEPARNSG